MELATTKEVNKHYSTFTCYKFDYYVVWLRMPEIKKEK